MALDISGIFWLPETPNTAVRGRLSTTDDGATRVTLFEPLTSTRDVLQYDPLTGTRSSVSVDDPIRFNVHGRMMGHPQHVSLMDCWSPLRRGMGPEFEEQEVQAGYFVRGAHIPDDGQHFTGVRVRVPGIEDWSARAGLLGVDHLDDETTQIAFRSDDLPAVSTTSGEQLSLSEGTFLTRRFGTSAAIERSAWVQVHGFDARAYREVLTRYVTPVTGYLGFALGTSVPLSGIQLLYHGQWIDVSHDGIRKDAESSVERHEMLLPLAVAGLEIMSGLLDVYAKVGPALPVVEDAISNTKRTSLETQLLQLATVAERVHRQLFPDEPLRIPEVDKGAILRLLEHVVAPSFPQYWNVVRGRFLNYVEEPNYKTRLRRLCSEVASALPGVCGNQAKWVNRVDQLRNSFAHGKEAFQSDLVMSEIWVLSVALRWVLMGNMLLAAGLPGQVLSQQVRKDDNYRFFLHNARRLVPKIYDDGTEVFSPAASQH